MLFFLYLSKQLNNESEPFINAAYYTVPTIVAFKQEDCVLLINTLSHCGKIRKK